MHRHIYSPGILGHILVELAATKDFFSTKHFNIIEECTNPRVVGSIATQVNKIFQSFHECVR